MESWRAISRPAASSSRPAPTRITTRGARGATTRFMAPMIAPRTGGGNGPAVVELRGNRSPLSYAHLIPSGLCLFPWGSQGRRRPVRAYNPRPMTYVVTEDCIKCKYMDCVEVCPVDCFYEGDNMLVIHPDECIDCGVCEPECPPNAILADSDGKAEKWLKVNAEFAIKWPNITRKGTAPADADEHKGEADKFKTYFTDKPGDGS